MADENEVIEMLKGLDAPQQESELPQDEVVEEAEKAETPTDEIKSDIEEDVEESEEEESEEEETYEVDEDAKVKVTVAGEEIEVSFGELRNGYMRQADYTRKTQEISDIKKEHKAEVEKLADFNKKFLYEVQNSETAQRYKELKEGLSQHNYSRLSAEEQTAYDRLAREADILEKQLNSKIAQYENHLRYVKEQEEKDLAEVRKLENEKLLEAIPELSDPAQKGKIENDIRELLVNIYGDKDARIKAGKSIDHRDFLLYRAASIGLKYMNSEAPKPTAKKIKNVRSGSNIKSQQEQGGNKLGQLIKNAKDKGGASDADLIEMLKNI